MVANAISIIPDDLAVIVDADRDGTASRQATFSLLLPCRAHENGAMQMTSARGSVDKWWIERYPGDVLVGGYPIHRHVFEEFKNDLAEWGYGPNGRDPFDDGAIERWWQLYAARRQIFDKRQLEEKKADDERHRQVLEAIKHDVLKQARVFLVEKKIFDLDIILEQLRERLQEIAEKTLSDYNNLIAEGTTLAADWCEKVGKLRMQPQLLLLLFQIRVMSELPIFAPRLMSILDLLRYSLNHERNAYVHIVRQETDILDPPKRASIRSEWEEFLWQLAGHVSADILALTEGDEIRALGCLELLQNKFCLAAEHQLGPLRRRIRIENIKERLIRFLRRLMRR